MKIESITIQKFKRFEKLAIQFENKATGEIANQFLVLGDNGTGKTTVLQAIALCLSMASGRIRRVGEFDWIGWVPGRYWRWGSPQIEMVVHFTDDEIRATQEAARRWYELKGFRSGKPFIEPANQDTVKVSLDGEHFQFDDHSTPHLTPQACLLRGRAYAAKIVQEDPAARDLFDRLPGIFWFDQFRNLATSPGSREVESNGGLKEEPAEQVAYAVGVARLREYLNRWKLQKLRQVPQPEVVDYLLELENLYNLIFPDRSFSDPEPMFRGNVPSPTDYYFMLRHQNKTYDIEEMSAGEQAVFPMLYEFVRQRIRNSVVLIDEIDLNLHPPLAQALLASLPRLGANCQFLYTTHSRAISEIVSPHEVYRLAGGRPCL
jgi:predicted ATPase